MNISIVGMGSVSALGNTFSEVCQSYQESQSFLKIYNQYPIGKLSESGQIAVENLRQSVKTYTDLDDTALFAILSARQAIAQTNWNNGNFGVNIGSSRGATALFEKHYSYFVENKQCEVLASPTTTLGNIASWVGQDLGSTGFEMSHSITCSTALHAVANGIAWIQSGMEQRFVVGGSEAPLTPFTIAQAKALKIYSNLTEGFLCRAMDMFKKQNTMVLGEGAAVFCLEKGLKNNRLATIIGVGFASEKLTHSVSLSANGECLQKSMRMALQSTDLVDVDIIVTHTPGTVKGDLAEIEAIHELFKDKIPFLTNNKWKIGHTFGASGALSLEMAICMLQNQQIYIVPYVEKQKLPNKIEKILINAVGFGGNAVSVLIER
ncbi:MAG: beta-ketoacyl synthase N-terminal-like domain-containing protein [Capnocytophaga sp.]|nr:beta-ketoacyl synthase N-terminal-like domain-containing protein [Capnocytophaga sp.]